MKGETAKYRWNTSTIIQCLSLFENAIEYVWSTAWHWHEGLRSDGGVVIDDTEIARLWPRAVRDPLSEVVKRNMQRLSEER